MKIKNKLKKFGYEPIETKVNHFACGVEYIFSQCFILTMDKYFACIPLDNMTNSEYKNIKIFIEFADGLMNENDERYEKNYQLDILLGKIVEILSPQYQAVSSVANGTIDDKLKVADLVTALGNLESMNNESIAYFNNTQILVQQALDDAMKKALIFG